MRSARALLVASLGALAGAGATLAQPPAVTTPAPPPATGLPPVACVEAVRQARIAGERGDAAASRAGLERAAELPGCELPALAALLPVVRSGSYPAERASALRARLTTRLEDVAAELPEGLLSHLALLPATPADDALLLGALERRLSRQPAARSNEPPPGLAELLDVTADLQQRSGKPEAARDNLGRLLALRPADEALRWRVVLLDAQLQRWESMATELAAMVDAPEAPTHLRELYASALARLGRYDDVLRQLDRLAPPAAPTLEDLPPSRYTSLLLDTAWALRDARRDVEAEAIFRRVLGFEPGQQEAQLALLHLYGTAEERATEAAAVAARRETETDPVALFEEGSDLLGAGDVENARAMLARAAPQLAGTDYAEPAWYNLGAAAFKLERWEEAANALGQAIAVNAGRAESHYKRGIALFHLKRCQEAAVTLRRTLELAPETRDAHYYLAGCYARLGDTAAAARENELFNQRH